MKIKADYTNAPQWKELIVRSSLPEELKCLDEIAHNLWWVWNYEARDLFRDLDPELYHDVKHNPVLLLERLSLPRKEEIVKDKALMKRIHEVYKLFRAYMDVEPDKKRPSVAYFSMEYGMHSALKIYSGGLGMLAGDYLKEASDSNVDMCAIGFLYRFGYFTQSLSMDGQQIAKYEAQNFLHLPIERQLDENGNPMVVSVPYTNYMVHAYVWRVNVGRIKLYLLDTDNEMNSDYDKPITHSLYGGDWENRLKQEILLGIGGVLTLKKLGIKKQIYHCNEGHAALCNLQRLCDYIEEEHLTFNQAMELVRASGLYTVHTPVPAGHDYFDEGLFGKYMGAYPQRLGITWDEFIGMAVPTPTTTARSSACLPSPATPVRRSTASASSTAGCRRRCSQTSGRATILKRTTWATSPTVSTSPHGRLLSGASSMPSTSTRASWATSRTRKSGRPSTRCPTRKSGLRAWR